MSIFDVSEPSNLVSILRYCSMQVQLLSNPKATWILTHGVENVTTEIRVIFWVVWKLSP